MPRIVPATSLLNLTPSSTELESSSTSGTAGTPCSKIVARGTTAPEAADSAPVPSEFVAATVNV